MTNEGSAGEGIVAGASALSGMANMIFPGAGLLVNAVAGGIATEQRRRSDRLNDLRTRFNEPDRESMRMRQQSVDSISSQMRNISRFI